MPIMVKGEDGTEFEAMTPDEVAAKLEQEREKIEAEKQAEIDRLEGEKASKEEELEKLRNKDYNFRELRKKTQGGSEGETSAVDEVKKQLEEVNKKLTAVVEQPINEVKTDFIKNKIGDDKEKKELFEYYYKRLEPEDKSRENILKAANEALILATNGGYKPNGDSKMYSTGVSQNYMNTTPPGERSEQSKSIGNALGVTDEAYKKYKKK